MKKLRLRLAQWLLPKGYYIDVPFMTNRQAEELAKIVDDGTDTSAYEGMAPASPSELWRETRKALVEDKPDEPA